jgi:hypothetical protein
MPVIRLPNNWKPRPYQRKVWGYWEKGGKYANLIWHRRSGKDEIALHRTAVAAFERAGTYWHLLPEAAHARKAIWTAVNPHSGKRRIDEAFPMEIRKTTREQEMFIEFVNGSTWQVGGSDRYNTLVGSSPAGVVFSEWALANPAAWAYVRPILLENNGWSTFITTPRGHNHAEKMYKSARDTPGAFAQILTAAETNVFEAGALERERLAYIEEYGEDFGQSMFDQEYFCSFDAAILGSYYGAWITKLKSDGRFRRVNIDHSLPVHTAWDLGHTDDTSIWFYQVPYGEVHFLDCYSASGFGADHYIDYVRDWYSRTGAKAGNFFLPHDAKAKTFASGGKSTEEQFAKAFGWGSIRIVPSLSVQDGIQAVREMLKRSYFDLECEDGLEALAQYQREWDDNKKCFRESPKHDWTSHIADAMRMAAVAYKEEAKTQPKPEAKFPLQQSINDLIAAQRKKRLSQEF